MNIKIKSKIVQMLLCSIILFCSLSGCATTTVNPDDPLENWNRGAQSFNDDVDEMILKPMAKGYVSITSESVNQGVTNFFSNITDIRVTINDLLQFKLLQGSMDASRFVINTTVGVAGIFDVATTINLPRHNEDFAQTLGVWGVPAGAYVVLPFWGSSSPRGMAGLLVDALMNPTTYTFLLGGAGVAVASLSADTLDVTDTRADLLLVDKVIDEAAVDRYLFLKDAYQQQREYLVHDGNWPEDDDAIDWDVEFEEELEETPPSDSIQERHESN